MADTGWISPGTMVSDDEVGVTSWTNPDNAKTSDSSYATSSGNYEQTEYLKATNFSFSIPNGATINGIVVEIERKSSNINTVGGLAEDIKIVKGGVISATDLGVASYWPTTDTYASYGSSVNLWGESWESSDINSSGFGVVLTTLIENSATASVNHIRITVYYTEGSVIQTVQSKAWIQGMPTHLHRAYQDATSGWVYNLNTADKATAFRFTPWSSIDVTQVSVGFSSVLNSPTYRVGIRADNSGKPSVDWLTSETVIPATIGWKHVTVPKYTLEVGTTYWIVASYESGTVGASNYSEVWLNTTVGNSKYPFDGEEGNLAQSLTSNGGSDWTLLSNPGANFLLNQMFGNPITNYASGRIYGDRLVGEYFQLRNTLTINTLGMYVLKEGTPDNDLLYEIRDTDENVLRSGTLAIEANATTSFQKFEATLSSPITFALGKGYRIIVRMTGGNSSNYYDVYADNALEEMMSYATYGGTVYAQFCVSTDAGGSWATASDYYRYDTFVEGQMNRVVTVKANIKAALTSTQTVTAKAKIICISKTVLVTPIDLSSQISPLYLVWEIPTCCQNRNIHANVQVDKTDDTFADLEKDLFSYRDSDFEYWDGDSWEPYPTTGVTSAYYGNQARVQISLTVSSKYWRVRGGVK